MIALAVLGAASCSDLPGIPKPGAAQVQVIRPDGVEILETSESGMTATFQVVLSRQPGEKPELKIGGGSVFALASSDLSPVQERGFSVTMAVTSSNLTEGAVSPSTLTFTSENWNQPQTVTVTGLPDQIVDGDQSYAILVGDFESEDEAYTALTPIEVAALNLDIDMAGLVATPTQLRTGESPLLPSAELRLHLTSKPTAEVAVTVTIPASAEGEGAFVDQAEPLSATVRFTSENWSDDQVLAIRGVDDDLADGDQLYELSLAIASSDEVYAGLSLLPLVQVTNEDDETAALVVLIDEALLPLQTSEAGGTATFEVRLSSQPTADVTLPIASSNTAEGAVEPASLTFTSANWSDPQLVTVTGVDDLVLDGPVNYEIAIGPAQSADASYANLAGQVVSAVNADDDTAGIVVDPASLVTIEGGEAAAFTVVLRSQPTAEVVISVTSADTTEGVLSPSALAFTAENWDQPQTLTVTPVDDDLADGPQTYAVVLAVTSIEDATYAEMTASVSVRNEDDEMASLMVAPTALTTAELGQPQTFAVRLTSEPLATVTVTVVSTNTTEGSVSPASLTFDASNWNQAQAVAVT
ncbi:MAG: hypothetical protein LBM75_05110, partial [Myxococcales bacterium]|nr:hypothetical protein [Myxococcales bacterium]